jgi:sulfoxide reductase heme-binding subunit YedZ
VVALLLLTAVMVLGLLVSRQGRLPGLPRFGVAGLHRSLSLVAVVFVAGHVITAIADPYVTIGLAAILIPGTSPYEPFWLGLGAASLDLMIALIATSLVRARLGRRTWRSVHWLAYACWPVAFAHSLGSSTDLQRGGLLWLAVGCALALAAALGWRVITASRAPGPEQRVAAGLAAAGGHREPQLAARVAPVPCGVRAAPAGPASSRPERVSLPPDQPNYPPAAQPGSAGSGPAGSGPADPRAIADPSAAGLSPATKKG